MHFSIIQNIVIAAAIIFVASLLTAAPFVVPEGAVAQIESPVSPSAFTRDSSWNSNYSEGRILFTENCADCHGKTGKGGLGLPLNLQSFLVIADKGYLVRSMIYGRETRGMPSFKDELTPAQMQSVALFIKSWQYQPSLRLPEGKVTGDATDGAKLFRGICAGCHGLDGKGGPEAGGGHVIGAVSGIGGPTLADKGFLNSATDAYIKATLMNGRIGTPMGSYLKGRQGFVELGEHEIDNIVSYLRSLELKE